MSITREDLINVARSIRDSGLDQDDRRTAGLAVFGVFGGTPMADRNYEHFMALCLMEEDLIDPASGIATSVTPTAAEQ